MLQPLPESRQVLGQTQPLLVERCSIQVVNDGQCRAAEAAAGLRLGGAGETTPRGGEIAETKGEAADAAIAEITETAEELETEVGV